MFWCSFIFENIYLYYYMLYIIYITKNATIIGGQLVVSQTSLRNILKWKYRRIYMHVYFYLVCLNCFPEEHVSVYVVAGW